MRLHRFSLFSCIGSGLMSLAVCAVLSACTRVPEIETQIPDTMREQDFPNLLPRDQLTAERLDTSATEVQSGLTARANRLRWRAQKLREREI